jgi:murein DD-endopeptidase MepM/ murein hydrolase activator NlpD
MRRVDRVRLEKRRRQLGVVGLAFTLGALTASSLMWRLDQTAGLSITDTIGSPEPGLEPRATAGTTAAPRATGISSSDSDDEDDELVRLLRRRRLEVPVQGVDRNQLHDSFDDRRGIRRHEAIDIMAPRGTLVLSVEDGRVAKLFESVAGGLTVYIFDPAEMFTYYYAHLDRYAAGLTEGEVVRRGEVIGYVGSTGNASDDAPHLHFAIFQLGPERRWWQGKPINPYTVLR